jgi:replicative DNA helicase
LEKREPAALFVGRHLLKGVTPKSPTHEREEAAAKLAAYAESLRGERSALYIEDLVLLASERTGYSTAALVDVAKRHEERRRLEERERLMDNALRKATVDRGRGADPLAVAVDLTGTINSVKVRAVDVPPAFSVDRLERESEEMAAGKVSGWNVLDYHEVLFNPGELAVLAGRTGHCKTSVLVGLLVNWAKAAEKEGRDEVLVFYSLEEPEVRIYHRLISLLAVDFGAGWTVNEVRDFKRGRRGFGSRVDYKWEGVEETLNEARETLRKWENRLLVVHRSSWTVEEIEAHARDMAAHYNVGAVLLDYLQRIPAPVGGRYDRRDIEVSTVARRLKALAVELSAPVVVGAQINREAVPDKYREKVAKAASYEEAKKEIKKARPDLYHIREGGAEQEADLVLGLLNYAADWRTEEDALRDIPEVTRLEVGTLKSRYGTPGRWNALAFEGRYNFIRDPYSGEV